METRASQAELIASGLLVGAGAYVLAEASGYPPSPVPGAPGPAFFPQLLAGLLILLSLLLAGSALRRRRRGEARTIRWEDPPRVAAVVGLAALHVTLFGLGAFYLATPFLLLGVMALMGERRPWLLALVPAGFVAFVYVVFDRAFGVVLPSVLF